MTNEEMQRAMEFILAQQAKFEADIQQLEINLQAVTDNVAKLPERIENNEPAYDKLLEIQAHFDTRAVRLEESFLLLVQLAENVDKRSDAKAETRISSPEKSHASLLQLMQKYSSRIDRLESANE